MPTSEENQNILDNVKWNAILNSIQQGNCIICIGPGVYTENNLRLEEQLTKFLEPHIDDLQIRLYDDGWIHFLPDCYKLYTYDKINEFYNRPFPNARKILSLLAQIPFHFYISATPDNHLPTALNGIPYRPEFYFKKQPFPPDDDMKKPTKEEPLVYHILGRLDKRESLVLTYDDFYDYLESFLDKKISMSGKIQEYITDADHLIFLGLPFDQWYMHLFLRMLQVHKRKDQPKFAPISYIPEKTRTYCKDQFNITFVPSNEESFVTLLFDKCKNFGLLRSLNTSSGPTASFPSDEIKNLISNAEIEVAFEVFSKALEPYPVNCKKVADGITALSGQFINLKHRFSLNLIKPDDYSIERSQISHGLLNLVNEAEICAKTR